MCGSPGQPLVSIVIASFNRAQLVARAVRSALAQTYPNVEVIVSDDCSPDDTLAVLSNIIDKRLKIHPQAKNLGCWGNWTAAVRLAKGEFLVFLGDDDELTLNFVESHLASFAAFPESEVVFSPMEDLTLEGETLLRLTPPFPPGTVVNANTVLSSLLEVRLFFGAAMFRLPQAANVWEFTEPDGMVADWGLIFRLCLLNNVRASSVDGCTYRKTVHPKRLSCRYIEVTGLIIALHERMIPHCSSRMDRSRIRRQAALERITLARHHAAERDIGKCRTELWACVKRYPWLWMLWLQLLQSYLWTARLVRSSREQRGLST
jgi:hypothetical protein